MKKIFAVLALTLTVSPLWAREYHVATTGLNANIGDAAQPFKTISTAAQMAQPGDTIIVHAGTYRERINPPRGGSDENKRIVYRAANDEVVIIKGSEIITNWKRLDSGIWKASVPNSFFGDYNPYIDVISGDWFTRKGRDHHTGEIYLNGQALFEEISLDKVKQRELSWYCRADEKETHLWANFGAADPNRELTEANARRSCFYPDKPERNFITVRGFIMRHAASQWAAPTAEQAALIGTHWSKGWIIENNMISDSKCVGLTLGKYGDKFDNTSANSAEGYVKTVERALANGWTKENIGSHIVRNNIIYNCGAAGICGSMGGAFSQITGNHVYNINIDKPYTGHEMAAIKFHAPIDTLIKNNRIHHTSRGIWLDWMTQGTRVTANLLYDNGRQDIYIEVNHGPYVIDNNIFLTDYSLKDHSQGGAFVHNLFGGEIQTQPNPRKTPYHKPHSTEIAGLSSITGGDNRFINNMIVKHGLAAYNNAKLPMFYTGNAYFNGAEPSHGEEYLLNKPAFDPSITLTEEKDAVYLNISLPESLADLPTQLVTSKQLGKNRITGTDYLDFDGSPLIINTDYFGKKRSTTPTGGPFENPGTGTLKLKVW